MLYGSGIVLILAGLVCLKIDRRMAHWFYRRIGRGLDGFLHRTTHFAKAAFWLAAAIIGFCAAFAYRHYVGDAPLARDVQDVSAAFICALALGTIIAHILKLCLGRHRPRDEIEMGVYGFEPFACRLSLNSFPSGHSLTIFLVAVMATSVWPPGAPLWFLAAAWLSVTRAMITAHYLSDVCIGAGIGLICAKIVLFYGFPQLALSWF